MKQKNKANELNVQTHSAIDNALFCLKCTYNHYPLLLLWCFMGVLINVSLPVLTTYLPKVVIDEITSGDGMQNLIRTVLSFTLGIALLLGFKHFVERYIYHHKFKMNSYYMRRVANKGMTTDYCNQEKDQFRKLQSESFQSCNGNYSNLTQVYDAGIALCSSALGFAVYFGILIRLSIWVILLLISTTLADYFLNKRIIKWASDHNKEKIGYQQKTNYINSVSGDIKSAKDIRLYSMPKWLDTLYRANMDGLAGWYRRYTAKIFRTAIWGGGLSVLREGIAYAYLLYLVLNSQISVADFVLYFGVITGFSLWLGGILGQFNALNRISLSVDYLRAYLEYPELHQNEGGRDARELLDFPREIELKNVCYRYEGAEQDTLRNVNLKIDPAEHLSVVGLNGAGIDDARQTDLRTVRSDRWRGIL